MAIDETTIFKEDGQSAPNAEQAETEIGARTTASGQVVENSFDLFPVFLEQLAVFLGDTAKSDEEIRIAFGLEKQQAKAWLADAVAKGHLLKLKNPTAYTLSKQALLC